MPTTTYCRVSTTDKRPPIEIVCFYVYACDECGRDFDKCPQGMCMRLFRFIVFLHFLFYFFTFFLLVGACLFFITAYKITNGTVVRMSWHRQKRTHAQPQVKVCLSSSSSFFYCSNLLFYSLAQCPLDSLISYGNKFKQIAHNGIVGLMKLLIWWAMCANGQW